MILAVLEAQMYISPPGFTGPGLVFCGICLAGEVVAPITGICLHPPPVISVPTWFCYRGVLPKLRWWSFLNIEFYLSQKQWYENPMLCGKFNCVCLVPFLCPSRSNYWKWLQTKTKDSLNTLMISTGCILWAFTVTGFLVFESVGRGFESLRAHQRNQGVMTICHNPFLFWSTL